MEHRRARGVRGGPASPVFPLLPRADDAGRRAARYRRRLGPSHAGAPRGERILPARHGTRSSDREHAPHGAHVPGVRHLRRRRRRGLTGQDARRAVDASTCPAGRAVVGGRRIRPDGSHLLCAASGHADHARVESRPFSRRARRSRACDPAPVARRMVRICARAAREDGAERADHSLWFLPRAAGDGRHRDTDCLAAPTADRALERRRRGAHVSHDRPDRVRRGHRALLDDLRDEVPREGGANRRRAAIAFSQAARRSSGKAWRFKKPWPSSLTRPAPRWRSCPRG